MKYELMFYGVKLQVTLMITLSQTIGHARSRKTSGGISLIVLCHILPSLCYLALGKRKPGINDSGPVRAIDRDKQFACKLLMQFDSEPCYMNLDTL